MSRFCLDTSAYSHFKRGDPAVVDLVTSAPWIGVPVVVLGELRAGFLGGRRADKNEADLRGFLEQPTAVVLDVDDDAARIYAEIVTALRRAGTPVPTNDLWIAAVAAREGATVLTYDSHFERISRVGVRVIPAER